MKKISPKIICRILNKAIFEKKDGFEDVVNLTLNKLYQNGGCVYWDRDLYIDYNVDEEKMRELIFKSKVVEFVPTEDPQEHPGITLRYKEIGHVEKKMSRRDIEERIANDVGMCHSVSGYKNAMSILCDLLYFTNLNTKWKDDVKSAIEGICPEYFGNK